MKNKTKKIIAKELLFIILSFLFCFLAYNTGRILDDKHIDRVKKIETEIHNLNERRDSCIISFRKNSIVDSIYKLQRQFHKSYLKIFPSIHSSDTNNYFFWINVRNSLNDSTFHLTYASDDRIIALNDFYTEERNEINYINSILKSSRLQRLNFNKENSDYYFNIASEFKYFASNNNFERFISKRNFRTYQNIRSKEATLNKLLSNEKEFYNFKRDDYLEITIAICLIVFFILRYLFFLISWTLKTIYSKEE